MSNTIKNLSQLDSAMEKYCYYAVSKMGEKVKKKIDEFIRYYYLEYTPDQYERTWKFLNSVVKTEPRKINNGFEVEVYIDTSLKYSNGWTMQDTADYANAGLHGNIKVGEMKFWDDMLDELPQIITDAFKDFMASKGINIYYH